MLPIKAPHWVLVAGAILAIGGCRDNDTTVRYHVSGSVTFAGKPVPAGAILFIPNTTKNNQGPPGFAKIKGGKFDTALDGKGTIGGPHQVRISGFDGRTVAEELPDGKRLFPDYTLEIDLPKETTTKDISIPGKQSH